uniref:KilA protein n=1 Tax=Siphoviridae sp. ct4085 TaxID=2827774 RepID=A0A8S5SF59_9CAUD|nr:MAG TPA: KilA protein [Siphoviridae sp. ct4085]
MSNQIFQYNGNPIAFQIGDTTMVNATQMAKPFGDSKRAKNWLILNSTNEFLSVLSKGRNLPLTDLVQVTKGGSNPGTWFHEDVALEFARWLSPQFAIWCNDRIKELMRYGMTATTQTIDSILADPDNAIKILVALKDERSKVTALEKQLTFQAPKIEYADNILLSENTYTTTEIAKGLNISACKLNRILSKKGVLCQQQGQWVLSPAYQIKGYMTTKSLSYNRKNGRVSNMFTSVWTEAGKTFIYKLINNSEITIFASVES